MPPKITIPLHVENVARDNSCIFYSGDARAIFTALFTPELYILRDTSGEKIEYQLMERQTAFELSKAAARETTEDTAHFTLPFDGEIRIHKSVVSYLTGQIESWNSHGNSLSNFLVGPTIQSVCRLLEFIQTHDNPDSAYAAVVHW